LEQTRGELMTVVVHPRRRMDHACLCRVEIAEQIMVMPAVKRRWTAKEVRELIDASPFATPRYELVDGELLVTPAPRLVHQEAVAVLLLLLRAYLETDPVGHALTSPADVELEPEFLSQPDVFVMPIEEWRRVRHERIVRSLSLAIEVLSPNSAGHDRVRKRPAYQRNVPEYWIVDLDARLVERWHPADDRPEILTQSLEWLPTRARAPLRIDLVAYFAKVLDSPAE
jgi:Uma2 family endonuclease